MKRKKILIIGGNGFIGRNLSYRLSLNEQYDIFSFDLAKNGMKKDNITYICGDFFDDYVLKNVIRDMDLVIHSLSTVNPGNSTEKYMQGYERDFIQTVKLCGWLESQKSNMIFLSSGGTVYGVQKLQPIKEETLPIPINHYGSVKLSIENVIRTFNAQSQIQMKIARLSNPYGPGQDYSKGVGFVDAAVKKAIVGKPIEIWGDGNTIRDYIYIDDACEMLETLISYKGVEEVFNLSSNVGISQNQIISELKKIVPTLETMYKEARSVDVRQVVLDNSKIKTIYRKKILSFETGLRKYFDYVNKNEREKE
jgi:Nucleoside-diphosphate-sugar epimerases